MLPFAVVAPRATAHTCSASRQRLQARFFIAAMVSALVFIASAASAQTLPSVSSGTRLLHLKADASNVAVDGNGDVLSWTA